MIDWSKYPNFTRSEFECRCGCGLADMDPDFMERLQQLRSRVAFPFTVTSGYRCPAYNASIGGAVPHPTGKAVDFATNGPQRFELMAEAAKFGFTGVGLAKTFIHLDTLGADEAPRPTSWTYG